MTGFGKRTFPQLQYEILKALESAPLSINDIAAKAQVNWNTTKRQLTLLKGLDCVREAFHHPRLRIYEITPKGKEKVSGT